jgi:hypothetical protein
MRLYRFLSVSFICASIVAVAAAAFPVRSFAAAQLAAGAKTSAQPTSTNPQQRQLQITFDPENEGGSFNVTSFQLSVQFDPTKVQVSSQSDVQLVGPYTNPLTEISESEGGPPPSGQSNSSVINNQTGFVSFIGGQAPVGNTQPGDVDIFSIIFTLPDTTSFDDLLFFKIFGDPGNNDFVGGTDPNDPSNTTTTPAASVIPTILQGSFNQFANQVAQGPAGGVPLPGALWTGAIAAAVVIALARRLGFRPVTAA